MSQSHLILIHLSDSIYRRNPKSNKNNKRINNRKRML